MNRKDRRAARSSRAKGGVAAQGLGPAAVSANLFASAIERFNTGRLDDAERLCRDILMFNKGHFDALHMLGIIATRASNFDAAAELFNRALAVNPRSAECHFNLAQVLRNQGHISRAADHLAEAAALRRDYVAAHVALGDLLSAQNDLAGARSCYEQAIAIDPRLVEARHGLANLLRQAGQLDEAAEQFRQVVAIRPDFAEAYSNLGVVLAVQGRWADAAAQYQRAIELRPGLADVYRNLGRALLADGRPDEALSTVMQGLAVGESDAARAMFVQCAQSVTDIPPGDTFRTLVARALTEGWGRPAELSPLAAYLFVTSAAGSAAINQAMVAPDLIADDGVALLSSLAEDRLLVALLVSAPVRNVIVERFLTVIRSVLLQFTSQAALAAEPDLRLLPIASALAQQCFINEYIFAETEDDTSRRASLRDTIDMALAADATVAPLHLAALGCFVPLHTLGQATTLLQRTWPEPVAIILNQQIQEPALEHKIAATLRSLTPIDDETSIRVRSQYEQSPYPRWVKTPMLGSPTDLDWYLRSQFPGVAIRPVRRSETVDVLIAGCGTGQHVIETAQRIADARILAIDLSRASLGYAERKSREARLRNVDYAQADILHLRSLGASFDVIESSGVLHHLRDPEQGWQTLVSLLRPDGVMHVGLYSAAARSDVRAARAYIIDRGYQDQPADIGRCRQDLLTFEDGTPLKNVTQFSDFFTTSECRDLLFHVQERQFTIPEIRQFLILNGLNFLGFTGSVTQAYRRRFPDDPSMNDLDRWETFEGENPMAFVNMYQFWVQKAAF